MSAIEPAGVISIGAAIPSASGALASASVDLQGQLAALLQASLNFAANPPSLALSISTLTLLISQLQAAIAVGVPSISVDISSSFQLQIAALQLQVDLLLQLSSLMATAGIYAYSWNGTAASFGADVNATVSGGWIDGTSPNAPAHAIILATASESTWQAMQTFFAGAV